MMSEKTVGGFLEQLASREPVPGGGGASALAGALGAALASMVGALTTGKKKYAQYQEDIERIMEQAMLIRAELETLTDRDAQVFAPLAACYSLPKETPEQAAYKEQVMEEALYEASLVPLQIMEEAVRVIKLFEELAVKGSRLAVSDVGVGAKMCGAALDGASLNVFINTRLMKNRERAQNLNEKADILTKEGVYLAEEIFRKVKEGLLS